ncbi:MAG: PilZ domain-containing protein [Alphaproteobacteria bacterium]|nr:PilZ domain-containing protein [Alphaproteobacteria bacterium]
MARVVGVTRSERRANRRATAPVRLVIEGETVPILNWSLGGFVIPYKALWTEWQCPVPVKLVVPDDKGEVELHLEARLVRQDRERQQLAGSFLELSADAFAVLNRYVARRLGASPRSK